MNAPPKSNVFASPQAYELTDESELFRLFREMRGYLRTCIKEHHGTDALGRQHAINALDEILRGNVAVKLSN